MSLRVCVCVCVCLCCVYGKPGLSHHTRHRHTHTHTRNTRKHTRARSYDRRTGNLQATDLGRIASHYYVTHTTLSAFSDHLKPTMTDIELLRLFALADEFK